VGEQRPMASGGDLDGGDGVEPVSAGRILHGASPKYARGRASRSGSWG
jgi:hypothetical protein